MTNGSEEKHDDTAISGSADLKGEGSSGKETNKEQLQAQQWAAEALKGLLARAVNENLPIITWSLISRPESAAITGVCDAESPEQRRSDFEAWREALYAEVQPSETNDAGGTRLFATVRDNYLDLSVDIIADVE
ncbi:hypothetical protein [Nonomuraea sp. NPDC049504]|uniref:hypothetical protein n=1 Tax=Nonomuraea sp. NPDC049504 TaxID=3154729 RepID=UPI003432A67D